ncbi:MAG: type II toxin-antitoxin system HicB family antitoxin [Clostridia bacterium]|nr:type II toxin-antitoxin system HicB family antitoxin [Clostridia bacterium]
MLSAYPACFFKEESGYSVVFPDLNYLSTCGDSLDEALSAAIDCLAGYLYVSEKDGEVILPPSDPSAVDLKAVASELGVPAPPSSFVNVVTVDVKEYAKKHFERSVKKTLTIPVWLNEAAQREGLNFSQVLQEALKERLSIN